MNTKIEQEDNGKKGRFILYEDDALAAGMTYSWAGKDKFIVDHTEVDRAFGGKGYGRQLVMKAVDFAREKGIKIIPLCPYAKRFFDKNEALQDLLYS